MIVVIAADHGLGKSTLAAGIYSTFEKGLRKYILIREGIGAVTGLVDPKECIIAEADDDKLAKQWWTIRDTLRGQMAREGSITVVDPATDLGEIALSGISYEMWKAKKSTAFGKDATETKKQLGALVGAMAKARALFVFIMHTDTQRTMTTDGDVMMFRPVAHDRKRVDEALLRYAQHVWGIVPNHMDPEKLVLLTRNTVGFTGLKTRAQGRKVPATVELKFDHENPLATANAIWGAGLLKRPEQKSK